MENLREIDELREEEVALVKQQSQQDHSDSAAPHTLAETFQDERSTHKTAGGTHQQHTLDIEALSIDMQTYRISNQQHRNQHKIT